MDHPKANEDLAKVFSWIKFGIEGDDNLKKKREQVAPKGLWESDAWTDLDLFEQKPNHKKISHVLKFLDIDPTEEEVRAIEEMMIDLGENKFSFKGLEKVFIRSNAEKVKEYDQLLQAFRSLKQHAQLKPIKPDPESEEKIVFANQEGREFILLAELDTLVRDYQGSYEKTFKRIREDLTKQSFVENDVFYYKDYLDALYNIAEIRPPKEDKKKD